MKHLSVFILHNNSRRLLLKNNYLGPWKFSLFFTRVSSSKENTNFSFSTLVLIKIKVRLVTNYWFLNLDFLKLTWLQKNNIHQLRFQKGLLFGFEGCSNCTINSIPGFKLSFKINASLLWGIRLHWLRLTDYKTSDL